MIPNLNIDSIKEILSLLNLSDYLKIFDSRSRPKFGISKESKKMLSAFKENNLIDNYEESSEKEGYYQIKKIKKTKSK